MNLPNKITVARFFLVPVFAVMILLPYDWAKIAALAVFVLACVSDFFDGYLARKKNLVTDFGKLMDPLADKLLVCTALICFVKERDNFPAWCAILIMAREFIISGIRQIAAEKNHIIMANIWGKIKTVTQMILCMLFIIDLNNDYFYLAQNAFVWIASFFTLLSLIVYIVDNVEIFEKASK